MHDTDSVKFLVNSDPPKIQQSYLENCFPLSVVLLEDCCPLSNFVSGVTFLVGWREQLYICSETAEEVLQEEQGILQTKTMAFYAKVVP